MSARAATTRSTATVLASEPPTVAPDVTLSATDLAGLMSAFNEVTGKLERTHAQLHAEVTRLNRELQQANEEIARSKRLAALGEMAAGIAHEVRNPLGSIRLYAEMLEQDLREHARERTTATKISRAAMAIDAIVGDVLMFSRELRLRPEPILAGELFQRALDACDGVGVPPTPVRERLHIEIEGESVEFHADPGLAFQAIVNVVRNAIEAMEGRENARLGLMATRDDDATCRIVVRDTGPGVTDEIVSRMFNPFFSTRAAGTGLGLPIVHRIMEAHGGSVRVRNNTDLATHDGPAWDAGAAVELIFPGVAHAAPTRTTRGR